MSISLTASNHGAGGGLNTSSSLDNGTYPCTLTGASAYKNNKYQSEEEVIQITAFWDTGLVVEGDDGNEYPVIIHDSFITFSFNEKANLTSRLRALGFDINPATSVQMDIDGITGLDELQHHKDGRDARKTINAWTIDGQNVFGREALVTIEMNDKGYPKVKSVSAPVRTPTGGKLKSRTAAAAPAGAPV